MGIFYIITVCTYAQKGKGNDPQILTMECQTNPPGIFPARLCLFLSKKFLTVPPSLFFLTLSGIGTRWLGLGLSDVWLNIGSAVREGLRLFSS